jgi:hypothetical protein
VLRGHWVLEGGGELASWRVGELANWRVGVSHWPLGKKKNGEMGVVEK